MNPVSTGRMGSTAGERLLSMVETEPIRDKMNRVIRRWPRSFDARLTERIVQEFVPRIEREVYAMGINDAIQTLQNLDGIDTDCHNKIHRAISELRPDWDR